MAGKQEKVDLEKAEHPTFGQELRREREMREISIREISDSTKISTRFLEAIEAGDFAALPAPVFTRGFIREYASYLGLDSEELVDRYMSIVAHEERRRETEEAEMRERISGRLPLGGGGSAWRWVLLALIAVVVLGAAIYFLSNMSAPGTEENVDATTNESVQQKPPASPVDPAAATEAESIDMVLRGTADSWIMLQIDEQAPIEFTLNDGGTREFSAEEKIVFLTVGNAGGVEVTLNGVQAEPLGRASQVVKNVEIDLARVNELLRRDSARGSETPNE